MARQQRSVPSGRSAYFQQAVKELGKKGTPPQGDQSKNPENDNTFIPEDAKYTVIGIHNGWYQFVWEGPNGEPGGYVVTNGQSSMFFDETGNMVMSTGVPGDSGCGGKFILNGTDELHNVSKFALEAKGTVETAKGTTNKTTGKKNTNQREVDRDPAISLYASGDTAIESNGGEVGIKGDNIIINAVKTLTLKAGEAINIESGDGSGKVNIHTGDYNINAAFLNEKITGGKHQDVDGTSVTNQILPGAQQATNSMGTINHRIFGNYYVGLEGQINMVSTTGNINLWSKASGYSLRTLGMSNEYIMGHKVSKIFGVKSPVSPGTDTWNILLGTNKSSLKVKAFGGFDVHSFFGKNKFFMVGLVNVDVVGVTKVKSPTIFLN
jgi:hypothetical protein